jgi:hypothetical protein
LGKVLFFRGKAAAWRTDVPEEVFTSLSISVASADQVQDSRLIGFGVRVDDSCILGDTDIRIRDSSSIARAGGV